MDRGRELIKFDGTMSFRTTENDVVTPIPQQAEVHQVGNTLVINGLVPVGNITANRTWEVQTEEEFPKGIEKFKTELKENKEDTLTRKDFE